MIGAGGWQHVATGDKNHPKMADISSLFSAEVGGSS